ncbi:MAG: hypothetical protein E7591_05935 [Ruminococcaceae bacterium]|nr:hypothetical protein [Oscillospiraceae bacterium]
MEFFEAISITSLWTEHNSTLVKVIWAFYIGIIIASVVMWYNQKIIGRAVKVLMKRSIFSPDKALTVKDAGIDSFFIRSALKKQYSALRRVIYCTVDKPRLNKNDFIGAKFYIPEEQKYRAEVKYHGKNTSFVMILITAVVMFFVALLCIEYIPKLLDMFNFNK